MGDLIEAQSQILKYQSHEIPRLPVSYYLGRESSVLGSYDYRGSTSGVFEVSTNGQDQSFYHNHPLLSPVLARRDILSTESDSFSFLRA